MCEQRVEVRVHCDDHILTGIGSLEDRCVRRGRQSDLSDVHGVDIGSTQQNGGRSWHTLVEQKPNWVGARSTIRSSRYAAAYSSA